MPKQNKKIASVKSAKIEWIDITQPTKKEREYLNKKFDFYEHDLNDILPPIQRPKMVRRHKYLFMILTFPYYDRKERMIKISEVDFFIMKNKLITVHWENLPTMQILFESTKKDKALRKELLNGNPGAILTKLLDRLLYDLPPMMDHINLDINSIKNQIFAGNERQMVREILVVKNNTVEFKKAMQGHVTAINRLIRESSPFFKVNGLDKYFENLIDKTNNIWDTIETFNSTIDALKETNDSFISFRLNDTMKVLTVISVIMLPVTLIASIFGMNTPMMPLTQHPDDFWIILGIMAGVAALVIAFFNHKKWM